MQPRGARLVIPELQINPNKSCRFPLKVRGTCFYNAYEPPSCSTFEHGSTANGRITEKSMSYLLDDVARSLANPLPRRKALKQLGGLFLGGLAARLATARANAQEEDRDGCHGRCREKGGKCCEASSGPNFCVPLNRVCCGNRSSASCEAGDRCCGGQSCCPEGRHCCGTVCCGQGLVCRNGRCTASRA